MKKYKCYCKKNIGCDNKKKFYGKEIIFENFGTIVHFILKHGCNY